MSELAVSDTPDPTEGWQAAYEAGREAYRNYENYAENPYVDRNLRERWAEGWLEEEAFAHGEGTGYERER